MRLGGVLALLAVLVAGCASTHRPPAAGGTATQARVPQPSDGWQPGQPGMAALLTGPIHITQGCATAAGPTLWPTGWTVQGSLLLDATGTVVAHDGQTVRLTGGRIPAPATTSCGVTAGAQVWAVEGNVS